ncbi:MAG: ABC transporter ATP-binding protein [Sphaerobacteraceae bacterium]|nr:MAG: ABC transporter ATP-binding protein [Sphaerobacteraceae bacterium]
MHFDRRLFEMTGWEPGVRPRLAVSTLLGVLGVAASIGRLILTAIALYSVFQGEPFSSIIWYFPAIAGLILVRSLLEYLRDEIADTSAAKMKVLIRQRVYDHVLTLGAGHFDQRRTGDAVNALVEGVERLEVFFGRYLPVFITAAVTPFLLFGAMVFFDFRTAMIFMTFALIALLAPYILQSLNERMSRERHKAYSALNADFLDSMQGLPTLKIFGQSGERGKHLAHQAREVTRRTMHVLAVNIGITGIIMFCITAASAIALSWGAVRVSNDELYFRTLLIVLMLGVEVFRPLQQLSRIYHEGMMGQSAAHSVYDLLDTDPAITSPENPVYPASISPEVRFENVDFSYGADRDLALRGCSFHLRPGETLGVVGPSGAGKSTLVSLLMRFSDPNRGRILIGGYDLRDLPLETIRQQISLVAQDAYLFDGTVADNLRLGRPDASKDEMERAAKLANAHDFIMAMPHGYETVVGERGTRLSGGQRQRIAIARALLKDAPILILDEALSSVDAENEATIQQALERLQEGRTTLTIAHRLSSVINADRILVLQQGEIVEEGTHPQLLRKNGVYAELIATQREAETEDVVEGQILDQRRDPDEVDTAAKTGGETAQSSPEPAIQPANIPVPTLFWRLLKMVRPWPGEFVAVIVSGLLHAITVVAVGVVGALLIGRVVTGGEIGGLIWVLLALAPITALFAWLDIWLAHDLAYRLLAELRIRLYNLLDRLSPAYMFRRRSGDLLGTATQDVELIELFYAHTIVPAMLSILVPTGVLIGMAWIHPGLALILLPFLLAVALTPAMARRKLDHLGEELREQTAVVNSHSVDSVQGLRTIVAFDYGDERQEEIRKLGNNLATTKHHFLRQQSIQMSSVEGLTALGSLAVLALGAWFVSNGVLERTMLPLATLLALSAFGPVASIAIVVKELSETVAAARRYFAIEDEPVPVDDGPGVLAQGESLPSHAIAFENVTFRYGPAESPALKDIDFRVDTGQTVALVGSSGAGKSTIAHLLLRYWDPQEGRITIGDRDIRDFKLDELRRQISLVAQDTYLFRGTLFENLRIGQPEATDEEVYAAARQANVHEFAVDLPDGYETQVGERGMQLSGGQRQRMAIARALLEDAPILILDEATSHLDAVNELEVRNALETLREGRTTVVIAHRLSTIRSADRILVLDQGHVVESGTHQELLALDGFYSRLISAQIRGWSMRDSHAYAPGDDD